MSFISDYAAGQSKETGFINRTVEIADSEFRYQVYLPVNYTDQREWPVVLFLHGSGEKGRDGLFQTEVGLGSAIRRDALRFPAIVVFPQTPEHWGGLGSEIAIAALDATSQEFNTDSARIYLTGLSMGGHGAWNLAYKHPDRFAAAAIICGWVKGYRSEYYPAVGPEQTDDRYNAVAEVVSDLPIWIFHGDADPVVPVDESRRMNEALQRAEADVRYSEFADVGHNAWDPAYAYVELTNWMFAQVNTRVPGSN